MRSPPCALQRFRPLDERDATTHSHECSRPPWPRRSPAATPSRCVRPTFETRSCLRCPGWAGSTRASRRPSWRPARGRSCTQACTASTYAIGCCSTSPRAPSRWRSRSISIHCAGGHYRYSAYDIQLKHPKFSKYFAVILGVPVFHPTHQHCYNGW